MEAAARRAWVPEALLASLTGLRQAQSIWLVGGAVRDALLGRPTFDLDLAVDHGAIELGRRLADAWGGAFYPLDTARDIGRVLLSRPELGYRTIDLAGLRGRDILNDLRLRDFTVNAMGVALEHPGDLLDPCGGLADLRQRRLRACSPQAIDDDPLRALRAVRLSAELSLKIDAETRRLVSAAAPRLAACSAERLRDELFLMFRQPRPAAGVRVLDHLGLLSAVFPDLEGLRGLEQPPPHTRDGWEHTLAVLDALSDLLAVLAPEHDPERAADLTLAQAAVRLGRFRLALNGHLERPLASDRTARQLLFLSALYHDSGKPATAAHDQSGEIHFHGHESQGGVLAEARGRALRLSGTEIERLRLTVEHHMRPVWLEGKADARAAHRFFRVAGEAGPDVVVLSLADCLGVQVPPPQPRWQGRLEVARSLLEAYYERREQVVDPPALLRGDDLAVTLGLRPGPEIGRLLRAIREAQAAGELSSRTQALELARRLQREGLDPAERED